MKITGRVCGFPLCSFILTIRATGASIIRDFFERPVTPNRTHDVPFLVKVARFCAFRDEDLAPVSIFARIERLPGSRITFSSQPIVTLAAPTGDEITKTSMVKILTILTDPNKLSPLVSMSKISFTI